MTNEEIAVALAEHEKEIGSLKYRVNDLEKVTETIQNLVISVKELAFNIETLVKEQERYSKAQERAFKEINGLKQKPAKRWDNLVTVIIGAVITGVIGYMLGNIL